MPNNKRPNGRGPKRRRVRAVTEAVGSKSRAAAAFIVNAVSSGESLSDAIPKYCAQFALDERDSSFVKEIAYGTLRHRRLLMGTLKPMFDHKINERNRIVQSLLFTALYQIVYMRVPPHAVVAASVSACGECGRKAFAPMVNAILRRFLREGATVVHSTNDAIEFSFPDWLYEHLLKAYGEKGCRDILRASNEKAPLFLRVENSKISTADFLQKLKEAEIEVTPLSEQMAKDSPSTVLLEKALNVNDIPGFKDGLCTVQDISAQLAAPLLDLGTDKLAVLDCCCAPGGKTAHILDLNPQAQVMAVDSDEHRLEQAKDTLSRLGRSDSAEFLVWDAQKLEEMPIPEAIAAQDTKACFDRILVDAPCSGTGVIRRHPDIKWLRRAKDIESLVAIQSRILDAAFARLKVGGILLYTTCSILPDENDAQIKAFLERHKDAQLLPFTIGGVECQTLQRLPSQDQGDGFFYARVRKVEA